MKMNMGNSVIRLYALYIKFLERIRTEVNIKYKEETEEIMSEIVRYIHFISYE